jgi:hypothetical protein
MEITEMETKFIEVTNGNRNWGKFLLLRFDSEQEYVSAMDPPHKLLWAIGWNEKAIWVLDLATREGAAFVPSGFATADLDKHRVWVCPMFAPFLNWLYEQKFTRLEQLPALVDIPEAPFAMAGYRRTGK